MYDLVLNDEGWADANILLKNISKNHNEYKAITYFDLELAIRSGDKRRHELTDQRIRALYGHTTKVKIQKEIKEPPFYLYHGTAISNLKKIKASGLQKMNRHYVHLFPDIKPAKQVALRKTTKVIVLTIQAKDAAASGINFYCESNIWLCDYVPASYIEFKT